MHLEWENQNKLSLLTNTCMLRIQASGHIFLFMNCLTVIFIFLQILICIYYHNLYHFSLEKLENFSHVN
jgi:hypothetical protein